MTTKTLARPRGSVPSVTPKDADGYTRIARELNFNPPSLKTATFLAFCNDQGIRIYDYAKVSDYMDQTVRKEARKRDIDEEDIMWGWFPFRERDRINFDMEDSNHEYIRLEAFEPAYKKLIPARVLANVRKIEKQFPQAKFFVTDYAVRDPDPFIAVYLGTIQRNEDPIANDHLIVFDVWDEPGFTG